MKKFIYVLFCAAALMMCGCNKDNNGNEPDPAKLTWASLVAEHPFLGEFPPFDGEIENCDSRNLGGAETVIFFDYKCDESVATTYYAKFIPAGFTKSDGSHIYRKTVGNKEYAFSGSYGGGNFGLSFSADSK